MIFEENMKRAVSQLAALLPVHSPIVYSPHSGSIAKTAYSVNLDGFRTCISCGSKTQPCCGH